MKVGGSVLHDERTGCEADWVKDLRGLRRDGGQTIVVHGGGRMVSQQLAALGEPVEFIGGQRVTTPQALKTVVQVLRGLVNAEMVADLNQRGIPAVGLSGVDHGLITGEVTNPALGRVGQVRQVASGWLEVVLAAERVPVVAPIVGDGRGGMLNANGDFVAAALAGAVHAQQLVFYTDSGGVRANPHDPASRVDTLSAADARQWIVQGRAQAGMIPKLEAALAALAQGVKVVRIGTADSGTRVVG